MLILKKVRLGIHWRDADMKPTVERVRKLFKYDPETGVLTRVESSRFDMIGRVTKQLDIWIDGRKYVKTHVIWAVHHGYWPLLIDHRDGDKTNTRLENLREVTPQLNQFNKAAYGKYPKGVVFKADAGRSKPWAARIRINGKKTCLGHFATMEEAAAAYKTKAEEIQGEFAVHLSRSQ